MCQGSADRSENNHGPWMDVQELQRCGYKRNRVSLPGDLDYGPEGPAYVGLVQE